MSFHVGFTLLTLDFSSIYVKRQRGRRTSIWLDDASLRLLRAKSFHGDFCVWQYCRTAEHLYFTLSARVCQ